MELVQSASSRLSGRSALLFEREGYNGLVTAALHPSLLRSTETALLCKCIEYCQRGGLRDLPVERSRLKEEERSVYLAVYRVERAGSRSAALTKEDWILTVIGYATILDNGVPTGCQRFSFSNKNDYGLPTCYPPFLQQQCQPRRQLPSPTK